MPYDNMHAIEATSAEAAFHAVLGSTANVRQHTLRTATQCSGIGVHSGKTVTMRLLPAPVDTGIVFVRTDLHNGARRIAAQWDQVVDTKLCTVIGNKAESRIATVEHLMAALYAFGVDNALIEIDGAEVPVMDGSADPFVFLLEMAGVVPQSAPRREIEILKTIEIVDGNKRVRLSPSAERRFSVEIAFDQAAIGTQRYDFTLSPETFKSEVSRARTFGFFKEVDHLRKMGLALGGSLDNAVVIDGDGKIINEEGLRYANEFVRHKVLDAVGDLALAGYPIRGHFHGVCSGHAMNNRLLRALFADRSAWRLAVVDDADVSDVLPVAMRPEYVQASARA